jgi:nitrite reductase/ring-hydroxylating ferredoxin subunit
VRGRAWSYLGFAFVTVGGYLGGHLAYRQGAGVNHAESVSHDFPGGWQTLSRLDDLPDGELVRRTVCDVDVLVVRRGSHIDVLADTCSHLGASLSEGTFRAKSGQGCVVCPWHGSTFQLADGAVVHGPATAPMPRFETRIFGGVVSVMLPGAG